MKPFIQFPCWYPTRLPRALQAQADLMDAADFLAVHVRQELRHQRGMAPSDPEEFLQEFLNRPEYASAIFTGQQGTGKSHAIKWMDLSIRRQDDSKYVVVTVPKSKVNLHGVLRLVVNQLPDEMQQRYKERLARSQASLANRATRRHAMLAMLALATREARAEGAEGSDERALEEELLPLLPHLFDDPHLQELWLARPGGIVDALMEHVTREFDQLTEPPPFRPFEDGDLPTRLVDAAMLQSVARPTQALLKRMSGSDGPFYRRAAVTLANRCLEPAIGLMLQFGASELNELMRELRRHVRQQGQELVLLIEDLARLQGLDLALVDALIDETTPGPDLCTLRWAAACTRGYFDNRLPDSAKAPSRLVYEISMDRDEPEAQEVRELATRRLAATRISKDDLDRWYTRTGGEGGVPNRCTECEFRGTCHEAFGAVNGVGLYPFTEQALTTMLDLVERKTTGSAREDTTSVYRPRLLIHDVLHAVLNRASDELEDGAFPSDRVRGAFMRPETDTWLAGAVRENLEVIAADKFPQVRTIFELWGSPSRVVEFPHALWEAFGVPGLHPPTPSVTATPNPTPLAPAPAPASQPSRDAFLAAIRRWGNGGALEQRQAQTARELVHDAIVEAIDWDSEGLERAFFAGGEGVFRPGSIAFRGQAQQAVRTSFRFTLPFGADERSRLHAALAIEGLWLFRDRGSWDVVDGDRLMVITAAMLREWAALIIRFLKQLPDENGTWNPAATATELLVLASVLGDREWDQGLTTTAAATRVFTKESPSTATARALPPAASELYDKLSQQHSALLDVALAWGSGTKGGRSGPIVHGARVSWPMSRLLETWELKAPPPDGVVATRARYGALAELHRDASRVLPQLMRSAVQTTRDRLDAINEAIPAGTSPAEVIEALDEVRAIAARAGVLPAGATTDYLDRVLAISRGMSDGDAQAALTATRGALTAPQPGRQWPVLVGTRSAATVARLADLSHVGAEWLDATALYVRSERPRIEGRTGQASNLQQAIRSNLERLIAALTQIDDRPLPQTVPPTRADRRGRRSSTTTTVVGLTVEATADGAAATARRIASRSQTRMNSGTTGIAVRARQLADEIEELEELQLIADEAHRYATRQGELETAVKHIEQQALVLTALRFRDSGCDVADLGLRDLRERAIRVLNSDSGTIIVDSAEMEQRFWSPLRGLNDEGHRLRVRVGEAWRGWVGQQIRAADPERRLPAVQILGQPSGSTARVRDILNVLRGLERTLPEEIGAFDRVCQLSAQLRDMLQNLVSGGPSLPDDVAQFLAAVETPHGAGLELLTSTVIQFLRQQGQTATFVVRKRP